MNILVTGGKGFIGSHVIKALFTIFPGANVDEVDSNIFYGFRDTRVRQHWGMDLSQSMHGSVLSYTIAHEDEYDYIIHLAAWSTVRFAKYQPTEICMQNVIGLTNILQQCQYSKRLKKFIFASSSAAIDPLTSYYGATKKMGEDILRIWSQTTGIPHASLRFGNVYGPGQNPETGTLISRLTEWAYEIKNGLVQKHKTKMFGDGSQTRDYIYIDDLVENIATAILNSQVTDVQICSTGRSTSTKRVVEIFRDIASGYYFNINIPTLGTADADPTDKGEVCLTPSTYIQKAQYVGLEEGIWHTLQWRLSKGDNFRDIESL